jgi:type IV pilus assembly protein PilQ
MQKRVSLDFRNTPIEDVIRIMAEQADVDIVKSPAVTGPVTVTLTDVPLEEALNQILAAHGYAYVLSQNMIRVITAAEKTEKPEVMQTRTFEIVYADVKEVVKALDKFKSKEGTVSSIAGTSYIIITDTESKIREITAFIEKIDRITPQILIEARIYDITSKDKLDLGVEWNAGRDTGYYTGTGLVVPPGTMGNLKTGDTEPFTTGIFRGDTKKTESTTGVLKFGWLNDNVDIDMIIKAQQENIDAKLLANPRILVLDNEKATFDIVSEIPYIERTIGTTTTETVQYKKVGVKLEVTPHVARDGMVRLHILPEFGVVVGYLSGAPIVDTRKVDTIALVKNGQTVVLGGLRKKDIKKQINKVPLLGDLPLAGALFRFTGEDSGNSEIVVFITTWIIKQQPVMSQSEQDAYRVTDFKGPEPTMTKAEKPEKAKE